MVPVSNISESSTSLTIDVMGSGGVSGYGAGHSLWLKLMKEDGTELAPAERIIGFNHVADAGNFEIYSGFSYRRIIENPSSDGFEFQIYGNDPDVATAAGCVLFNLTVTVTEHI